MAFMVVLLLFLRAVRAGPRVHRRPRATRARPVTLYDPGDLILPAPAGPATRRELDADAIVAKACRADIANDRTIMAACTGVLAVMLAGGVVPTFFAFPVARRDEGGAR